MKTVDVAIIGAGMVGLALANRLTQLEFSVAVIDAIQPELTWDEKIPALRVSAINLASQQFLQSLNAWPNSAAAYQKMQVWDANSRASIIFAAKAIGQPHLGHIVENRALVKALWEQTTGNVFVGNPEIQKHQDFWNITLENRETIKARLLVGADGKASVVRKALGIGLCQEFSGQSALVCAVETEKPHKQTAYQRFLSSGPLAFLPLKEAHQCSIVWSLPLAEADRLIQLDMATFNSTLAEAFERRLGSVKLLTTRVAFSLHRQHAEMYIKPQAVLIGDAAHVIHPLAGQGVNLGFADVMALTEALSEAKRKGRPFYGALPLAQYQRLRYGKNTEMLLAMEGFNQLFASAKGVVKWLREVGVCGVNRLDYLKVKCMQEAVGL